MRSGRRARTCLRRLTSSMVHSGRGSAPRLSSGAEAFMPIEADLERSSVLAPGGGCRCARVAGLLKASELYSTFMWILLVQRA